MLFVVFFKQKTAYELRISDWSSDVCSSDLPKGRTNSTRAEILPSAVRASTWRLIRVRARMVSPTCSMISDRLPPTLAWILMASTTQSKSLAPIRYRSEEHTSELQSLMRISYAVFCLKKKKI